MRYYLSIDFYDRGEVTDLEIGDPISFVSLKGRVETGTILFIEYLKDSIVPTEYKVMVGNKTFIAISDYVIRKGSGVKALKTNVCEIDNCFPLRT